MMDMTQRIIFVSAYVTVLLASVYLRAADEAGGKSNSRAPSLDELLLEGLDDEPAAKAPDSKSDTSPSKAKSPLDDELLRELGGQAGDKEAGEDIGASRASPDPLVAIGRQMRDVESRLTEQRLDTQTRQLQEKILADLAVLMQECKKQCQGGGSKPGSKSGKPGQGSQAGNNPAGQAPNDAARDSMEDLRNRATENKQNGALVNAMKESWGSLPEHARQHLRNMNTDVFLPKYELMLEKYFKRLSEEDHSEP
jgi:hypothetical protein